MSWECCKGWHSHPGSNSKPVTFFGGTLNSVEQQSGGAGTRAQDSADHLGNIRQNQQQRRGKENESGLANFRMFEHG